MSLSIFVDIGVFMDQKLLVFNRTVKFFFRYDLLFQRLNCHLWHVQHLGSHHCCKNWSLKYKSWLIWFHRAKFNLNEIKSCFAKWVQGFTMQSVNPNCICQLYDVLNVTYALVAFAQNGSITKCSKIICNAIFFLIRKNDINSTFLLLAECRSNS